jgi:hypothetical protein
MKFLLLAITLAVALATAGDITGVALAAVWNNATSGKLAESSCTITATVTLDTITPSAATYGSAFWIVNSAVAGTWPVNTSVWYVKVTSTYANTAFGAATITASGYLVGTAVALHASNDILTASLTTDAFAASSVGTFAATGYPASFNLTWKQFDHMNSTMKLAEKAHVHYTYEASSPVKTHLTLTSATAAVLGAATPTVLDIKPAMTTCGTGFAKVASVSSTDSIMGSLLALAFF